MITIRLTDGILTSEELCSLIPCADCPIICTDKRAEGGACRKALEDVINNSIVEMHLIPKATPKTGEMSADEVDPY